MMGEGINKIKGMRMPIRISLTIIFVLFASMYSGWYLPAKAEAVTVGPNSPTVASGTNWTTPTNVYTSNDARAVFNGTTQNDLRIMGFSFNIPDSATITGITVTVEGNGTSAVVAQRQYRIGLTKDGSTLAGARKTAITMSQTIDGDTINGGPADLWGTTWTWAEVNDANFGVLISDNDATAAALNIDWVRVTIDYNTYTVTGNGYLLKRSQEDTCHACHLTDQNTWTTNVNAIRTHNSATLNSSKWSSNGGWGVTSGKYGKFTCTTCHTGHDTKNIYLIKEIISTPDGTKWGSTNSQWVTVDFRYKSGTAGVTPGVMGDDTNTHATSTRVCQVCHSQTNYHKYNQTTVGHNNAVDCTTSCHRHKVAFSGGGACDSCHGAPPGYGVDTNTPAQYAASHAQHFDGAAGGASYTATAIRSTPTAYVIDCGRCHNAQGGNTHNTSTASPPPITVLVTLKAGETFTRGANWMTNAGPPGPKIYYNFDSKCSSVYCHGNFTGGTAGNVPVWGSSSTGNCGTCHGASIATPPSGGSHLAHVGTASGLQLSCSMCHKDTVITGFTTISRKDLHVNQAANWNLDTTDSRMTGATYNGSVSGSDATLGTYGQCSNIYCHSTAQASNGTWPPTYATPTWGSAPTGACGTCHLNATIASGSHLKHVSTVAGYGYTNCTAYCHSGAGDNTPNHANYNINVSIPSPYWGTYSQMPWNTPGVGYGSCSSTYCHSTGAGTWRTTPTWGSATTGACGTCHGVNNITAPASAAHSKHVSTISRYEYACSKCHSTVVTATASSRGVSTIAAKALHVDNIKQVAFDSFNPIGTITGAGCLQLYCHSQGTGWTSNTGDTRTAASDLTWRTVVWTGTTSCGMCHGTDTTGRPGYTTYSPKANSHMPHLAYDCSQCHYATTGTNGTVITSIGRHVNKVYDLLQKPTVSTFTYAYNASGGTCSNISCHNNTAAVWGSSGSAAMDCIGCHSSTKAKTNYGTGTIGNFTAFNKSGWTTMLRNVAGAGGDFTYASRHIIGTATATKWDCIVCHREGLQAGGSDATNHKEGLIHLRNVDTINNTVGWAINNRAWGTLDYTNLDNFCMSCHDANGASAFNVNAANNGIATTNARALTPFNTNDTPGGVISGSTNHNNTYRNRVIDVKTQFYAGTQPFVGANYNGNPSQHAVIGYRYSTIWTSWSASGWNSVVLKKMARAQNVTREVSLLSCADCHVLDAGGGAHGGGSAYNLWSTGAGAAYKQDVLCFKCHSSTSYADGSTGVASRVTHGNGNTDCGNVDNAITAFGMAVASKPCLVCHASWNGSTTVSRRASYGGIHGSWTTNAWYSTGANKTTAYRFFPGVWYRINRPNDMAWNTRATINNCYFWTDNTVQGFTNCTRHTGVNATDGGASNYNRPVKY